MNTRYIDYLPPIFQQENRSQQENDPFLERFLQAFEQILTQSQAADKPALETKISQSYAFLRPLATAVQPHQTPSEFLTWLAGWVALTLREDWDETTQRRFIREVVPLYKVRGTKSGLTKMLQIYLKNQSVEVWDHKDEFGFDPPAHFFQVKIDTHTKDPIELRRIQQVAQAIIEQEKPTHTYYALQIETPKMQLLSSQLAQTLSQPQLQLGINSQLGTG